MALQGEDTESQVRFPNGSIKDRRSLYGETGDALFNKGPKIELGGIPGPWFKIRKDAPLMRRGVRA